MAKIGLNNFRYGLLTENPDGTVSYAGAQSLRRSVRSGLCKSRGGSKRTDNRIIGLY